MVVRATLIVPASQQELEEMDNLRGKLKKFEETRSFAVLRAADLDWIVELGYNWGRYILGCFVPPPLSSEWHGVTTDIGTGISKNVTNAGSELTSGQE